MKADSTKDLTIGGGDLASHAFEAGLVDECHLFFWPIVLGGGKPALPVQRRLELQLLDERRTSAGVARLRYLVSR
jgi:dihydrofolate reductase